MKASSGQTCHLWDCQDVSKYFQESLSSKDGNHNSSVIESYSATCADWSSDGKILAIDKTHNVKEIFFAKNGHPDAPKRPNMIRIITENVKILDMPKEGRRFAAVGRYYGVNESPLSYTKEDKNDLS